MNARQFFDKVALMRKLQKEYFRTRSKTALNQSKAVEREVDAEIARVHDALGTPATKQPEQRMLPVERPMPEVSSLPRMGAA